MPLRPEPLLVPLRTDQSGTVRVGDCQVILDVVIRKFHEGADPESIVHAYSTLRLADVYAVIAYYLNNRAEVDAYLEQRCVEAEKLRAEIEAAQSNRDEFREMLLARMKQREQRYASPAQ